VSDMITIFDFLLYLLSFIIGYIALALDKKMKYSMYIIAIFGVALFSLMFPKIPVLSMFAVILTKFKITIWSMLVAIVGCTVGIFYKL